MSARLSHIGVKVHTHALHSNTRQTCREEDGRGHAPPEGGGRGGARPSLRVHGSRGPTCQHVVRHIPTRVCGCTALPYTATGVLSKRHHGIHRHCLCGKVNRMHYASSPAVMACAVQGSGAATEPPLPTQAHWPMPCMPENAVFVTSSTIILHLSSSKQCIAQLLLLRLPSLQ